LPTGAESALVLGDAKTFDIFMSFDDPEKVKAITNYLTDQDDSDISLKKIRAAIVSESDFKDIDNIISRNTPFNNSKTLVKMDQIKETLSLYAANLMRNNPGMSVNNAAKEASLLFSDNYQIEDTYYFPKNIPGINQKQRDFTISKLENIKFNYIKQHFKPVAYESSVEGKTDLELTERMNYNIIENGEWRNHPNGEGFVFGIVLSGNSFGILKNEAGEELFVSYDDDSLILPGGSNTIIDMSIPTEQQKKQYRGYYGYADKMKQENTTFGQRTNLDNNEMQNALEDSGASTVKISDVFSTSAEASEMPIVDSIDTWNKFYKTETKIVNGNAVQMTQEEIKIQKDKATKRLKNGNYNIPSKAKSSIDIATNIFAGQNGISKEQLTKLLSDIGQIESQYNTKIQYKGGPARSYWQVEAASALDTLEQNAASNNPIFGPLFEKQFAAIIKGKSNTTVLEYLSSLSNSKMQKLLLNNSDLAATIALGIVLNRQ